MEPTATSEDEDITHKGQTHKDWLMRPLQLPEVAAPPTSTSEAEAEEEEDVGEGNAETMATSVATEAAISAASEKKDDSGEDIEIEALPTPLQVSKQIDEFMDKQMSPPAKKKRRTQTKRKSSSLEPQVMINEDDDIIIAKPAEVKKLASTCTAVKAADKTEFERLIHGTPCNCNNKLCRLLLKEYYDDPQSPYPMGRDKPQLLLYISNPRREYKNTDKQTRAMARKQRLYDRAVQMLNVPSPDTKNFIRVGIHHFSRAAIEYYYQDQDEKKVKRFVDYVLPSDLVGNDDAGRPKLGREFTEDDKFNCIGTTSESKACKKEHKQTGEGKCFCNLYMNLPFVTLDEAKDAMGQKIVIITNTKPPKPEQSEYDIQEVDDVKTRLCKTCNTAKPKEEYTHNQWYKPDFGRCQECIKKESEKVNEKVSKKAESKKWEDKYNKLRKDYEAATKERDAALSKQEKLQTSLTESRKKAKNLQKKSKTREKRIEQMGAELKHALEMQSPDEKKAFKLWRQQQRQQEQQERLEQRQQKQERELHKEEEHTEEEHSGYYGR